MDKPEDAIKELKKAIKLDPAFAIAHNNLGTVYFGMAKYDDAITEFDQALQLDPDFLEAKNNLKIAQDKKAVQQFT